MLWHNNLIVDFCNNNRTVISIHVLAKTTRTKINIVLQLEIYREMMSESAVLQHLSTMSVSCTILETVHTVAYRVFVVDLISFCCLSHRKRSCYFCSSSVNAVRERKNRYM